MDYPVRDQIADILPFFAVSAVMALAVFCISFLPVPQWLILLLQLAAGVAIVVLFYEFVYRTEEYLDVKSSILRLFRK